MTTLKDQVIAAAREFCEQVRSDNWYSLKLVVKRALNKLDAAPQESTPSETPPPAAIDELIARLLAMLSTDGRSIVCNGRTTRQMCADIEEAATELTRLKDQVAELKAAQSEMVKETGKWARQAGEAKGRLETSEIAGVVELWKERATKAEAELAEAKREKDESCRQWRDQFDAVHQRAMKAEADNRALVDALKQMEKYGTSLVDDIDRYNRENKTALCGGTLFKFVGTLLPARTALQQHAAN